MPTAARLSNRAFDGKEKSALRKNLTGPLVLLGFDESGGPAPRLGECELNRCGPMLAGTS